MASARRASLVILAVVALVGAFALARGPLHAATFALPVSNDDAILLLMGRHVLRGELATILWNQPYNGALDAYLLAPLLAIFPHHAAYRLYELVCAVLLVLLAFALGRRLGGARAGFAAALLAAWGTPYMALMTASGPPPNFLMPLVTGLPLVVGLTLVGSPRDGANDTSAEPRGPSTRLGLLFAVGIVCGLAVWNSSLAIPAFTGMALGLVLAGLRPRPGAVLVLGGGLLLGASPLLLARLIGASGAKVVTAASAVTAVRPSWQWGQALLDLGHALVGLLGLAVPLVVDGKERAALPVALAALLGTALVLAIACGSRSLRALPLVGWAAALLGAFWLSRRSGPDELRYLYGLNAPFLALAGAGLASVWTWRRGAGVALGLAVLLPWGWGDVLLTRSWKNPAHAERVWEVPSLDPVLAALDETGARSAYASLQFAGRITLETGGRVTASQAWNERIPGDPLRFRDEVDLDPAAVWVLSERLSRGMPRAGGFRELLRASGGSYQERRADGFVIFHGFVPPYDEARPVPLAALSLSTASGLAVGRDAFDRDPATRWSSPDGIGRGSGLVLRVLPSRRLSALVLLVDLERSPLAVPWAVSVDGTIVAQGPARAGLQWVNGAPRAGRQALLAVPLGERNGSEVRLVFQGSGPPLVVGEVFVYGSDEPRVPEVGRETALRASAAAHADRWDDAVRLYAEAIRAEPGRASYHAGWERARWRAAGRRFIDVESLDDGGPDLVLVR